MYRASVWAALASRRRVIPVLQRPVRADLRELVTLAVAGLLRPPVTRIASMDEVPRVMRELEAGHGRGKFVVRVT